MLLTQNIGKYNKINVNNKRAGAFSQLENGAQHIRQVSFRLKKKTISKKMARSQWHGAADKVRVRIEMLSILISLSFFEFSFLFYFLISLYHFAFN